MDSSGLFEDSIIGTETTYCVRMVGEWPSRYSAPELGKKLSYLTYKLQYKAQLELNIEPQRVGISVDAKDNIKRGWFDNYMTRLAHFLGFEGFELNELTRDRQPPEWNGGDGTYFRIHPETTKDPYGIIKTKAPILVYGPEGHTLAMNRQFKDEFWPKHKFSIKSAPYFTPVDMKCERDYKDGDAGEGIVKMESGDKYGYDLVHKEFNGAELTWARLMPVEIKKEVRV